MNRAILLLVTAAFAGCQPNIYLRDGVTDGDTFYLSPLAYANDDPAVASWVRYSLILSTCQLQTDSDIPSRNTSFDCELKARQHLVDAWKENRGDDLYQDVYLDSLADVGAAGFLAEYTAHYLGRPAWVLPPDLQAGAFSRWRREYLARHRSQSRLIGHWGYRREAGLSP